MILHRKRWLIWRWPVSRSRSLWTASWRWISASIIRIHKRIQIRLIVFAARYRHLSAACGRLRRRITTCIQFIVEIRFRVLALRWRHILIVHGRIAMWILITWMVHFFFSGRRLQRHVRSRYWLIREVKSNIRPRTCN